MVRESLLLSLLGALALAVPASAEDAPAQDDKCVARWDAGTHMTKDAWRETCKRVSDKRSEYLKKQGAQPERK